MSKTSLLALAVVMTFSGTAQIHHVLVTSTIVKVATMAARDEGYDPDAEGTFLAEMRTPDRKEPYLGYASIALYHDGHPVRFYSIRIETGDVIDATDCKAFRFPDLLEFNRKILKEFGSKQVDLETIASEVGCGKLEVVPTKSQARGSK